MQSNNSEILQKLGIKGLNEMQQAFENAWKLNNDLILLSPTGSGKTLAFLLPLLSQLNPGKKGVQALILSPARELSLQIENVFKSLGTGFKVNCCYGGHSIQTEKNNLTTPPTVLIGTPGRIADHIRRNSFDCKNISSLVLDEFDKALELGFKNEMNEVVQSLPKQVKKVLTSATRGIEIPDFMQLISPVELNFIPETTNISLTHKRVIANEKDKLDALFHLIGQLGDETSLIFCNHRDAVDRIGDHLTELNVPCGVFHGGMEQTDRERALIKFRNGSCHLLVVTDLASRGLDIPEIKNVIHYQLPKTEEAFIHRNGRTARMKAEGTSIMVLSEDERAPDFIANDIEILKLSSELASLNKPKWETLYIDRGRKEKINKVDLVGFFFRKGKLKKEELGKIDVLDHCSYVAVKRGLSKKLLGKLKNEPIKKRKVRIQLAR